MGRRQALRLVELVDDGGRQVDPNLRARGSVHSASRSRSSVQMRVLDGSDLNSTNSARGTGPRGHWCATRGHGDLGAASKTKRRFGWVGARASGRFACSLTMEARVGT